MGRIKVGPELPERLPNDFFGLCATYDDKSTDVIVVSTQENANASHWLAALTALLKRRGYHLPYGGASLNAAPGGSFFMTVAVFVRRSLLVHISDVRVGRVTCGMGNKVLDS